MTNDLTTTQSNELTILKQENEILKLKFELQKTQAQKASRLEDSLFSPGLFDHYQKVAGTLAKSNMIPNCYKDKPGDIFVAMAMGYQLGFPVEQALQDIAVINGRPCLWGDGVMALVLNHPACEGITETPIYHGEVITGYVCTAKRKGHEPHSKQFTVQDAQVAGLLKKAGTWTNYPTRMLQMRARSSALRDKFADALRGLRIAEVEEEDAIEGEIVSSYMVEEKQVDKLKMLLKNNNPPVEKIEPETGEIIDQKKEEVKVKEKKEPIDNSPATDDQVLEIQRLMEEKSFDDVRRLKALDYFKVSKLVELTNSQAKVFLLQLSRA